jgi:hypothetical protein
MERQRPGKRDGDGDVSQENGGLRPPRSRHQESRELLTLFNSFYNRA